MTVNLLVDSEASQDLLGRHSSNAAVIDVCRNFVSVVSVLNTRTDQFSF